MSDYADIPDYDCDQPGLDVADLMDGGHVCTPEVVAPGPAPRTTDVEHTTVVRLGLWNYQLSRLRDYARLNADPQSPDGNSVLKALDPEAVKRTVSTGSDRLVYFDLDWPARRWLRRHRRHIAGLFNQAGGDFRLVRKLFE